MSTIIQVSVMPDTRLSHQQSVVLSGRGGGGDSVMPPSVKSVPDRHQRHHHHHQQHVLPKQLDLSNSDNALFSVYCFIKNFIGAPAGTSTVAIDNKIEQAMDLVKSHLMFAVREEVDVLKEKITELMDRISQLELENGILKANATQETLSQLPQGQTGQVVTQNTQNNQTGQQQTVPSGGQLIRPPNANQTQNNQTAS